MSDAMPHPYGNPVTPLLRPVLLIEAIGKDFNSILFFVAMRIQQNDVRAVSKILVC